MKRYSSILTIILCSISQLSWAGVTAVRVEQGLPAYVPRQEASAFWVNTQLCSVVLKTSLDSSKSLQSGTPLDSLLDLPAVCSDGLNNRRANFPTGIRTLLEGGYRMTSVSHQVTPLSHSSKDEKVELLISAIIALEQPRAVPLGAGVSR